MQNNVDNDLMTKRAKCLSVWGLLIKQARRRQTIVYEGLAYEAQTAGAELRGGNNLLARVHDYCIMQGLPPLDVLVVRISDGLPAGGYQGNAAEDLQAVFGWNWWLVQTPNPEDLVPG